MANALIIIVVFFADWCWPAWQDGDWSRVGLVDFLGGALSAPSPLGILIGFIAVPLVLAFLASLITKVYEVVASTLGR